MIGFVTWWLLLGLALFYTLGAYHYTLDSIIISRIAIPSLYEETRQQLAVRMKKEANYFSGTTDLW